MHDVGLGQAGLDWVRLQHPLVCLKARAEDGTNQTPTRICIVWCREHT